MVGRGVFIVCFESVESCIKVTTGAFQFFDQKPLITKLWDPDMTIDKDDFSNVPIQLSSTSK